MKSRFAATLAVIAMASPWAGAVRAAETALPDEAPLAAGPAAQGQSTLGKVGELVDIGGILFIVTLTGLFLLDDNSSSSSSSSSTSSTSSTN